MVGTTKISGGVLKCNTKIKIKIICEKNSAIK
jgi:hypothetical protein